MKRIMVKRSLLISLALILVLLFVLAGMAQAKSEYVQQIPADVGNKSCSLCHTSPPELNSSGKAWLAAGKDWGVFRPKATEKPQTEAKPAAKAGAKELPKTGGVPYFFVAPGLAAVTLGLALRRKKA